MGGITSPIRTASQGPSSKERATPSFARVMRFPHNKATIFQSNLKTEKPTNQIPWQWDNLEQTDIFTIADFDLCKVTPRNPLE